MKKAIDSYEEALKISKKHWCTRNLGVTYLLLGDLHAALNNFEKQL